MMTLDEAKRKLEDWYSKGCVGNIWFFRAPKQKMVDGFIEQTIKKHEMSNGDAEALDNMFFRVPSMKMELFTDSDGAADRIKITRGL